MKVAITDASVFIDLFEINGLAWLSQLGLEVHTTNLVLYELSDAQQAAVRQQVSVVNDLSFEELETLASLGAPKGLSETDLSLLWYSQQLPAQTYLLLSSDNLIRKWCLKHRIEVHGILWILDQMLERRLLHQADAYTRLIQLMRVNQWLPLHECEARLRAWEQ